jgi:hypothetical protein
MNPYNIYNQEKYGQPMNGMIGGIIGQNGHNPNSNPNPYHKKRFSCGTVTNNSQFYMQMPQIPFNMTLNNSMYMPSNNPNVNNCGNCQSGNFPPIFSHSNSSNTNLSLKVQRETYSAGVNQNVVSNIITDNFYEDGDEDFDQFLEKIGNNLIPYIKTQKGSRYMQKFLNKLAPEKVDKLLFSLAKDFKEVMVDNYGNYFMQKLTQCCSSNQRMFVLQNVSLEIFINKYAHILDFS